jgi:GH15 family glucan-1,4-alpha-glucosidase
VPEPIGSYGLLGDTRTAALVSEQGSIDWMCAPRFDGDPLFGALIDRRGGSWSLRPRESVVVHRRYAEGAVSLETTWRGPRGVVRVREGLVSDASSTLMPRCALIRRAACVSGSAEIETIFDPRAGLPGRAPDRARIRAGATILEWGALAAGLTSDGGIKVEPRARSTVSLREGETASFVLSVSSREPLVLVPPASAADLLRADDDWWRRWLRRFDVPGSHGDRVARSLLTLRLLTYAPSGAPVAAPTTSLPALSGGGATWDYRFSWPRDASIGVGAFLAFGSDEEPRSFLDWFVNASRITRPRLKVLYNLDGRPVRGERELGEIDGYDSARPVRAGNGAAGQHQLDVYGWVIDAAWNMHLSGNRLDGPQWRAVRSFADFVAREWRKPDHGVWEEREAPRHYVHSKLMAWAGLDRALRMSASYPAGRRAAAWRAQRELLAREIRTRGYDARRGAYLRTFDGTTLDASLLILPVLDFDGAPRVCATIDAIRRELGAGGSLLYRFLPADGTPAEGAFMPCSFWLVQALARTGRLDEAEAAFDELCALSSPLGLYAEQVDPRTRRAGGNFPQAFTHATLLQAAAALSEARRTYRASSRRAHGRTARSRAFARRS